MALEVAPRARAATTGLCRCFADPVPPSAASLSGVVGQSLGHQERHGDREQTRGHVGVAGAHLGDLLLDLGGDAIEAGLKVVSVSLALEQLVATEPFQAELPLRRGRQLSSDAAPQLL